MANALGIPPRPQVEPFLMRGNLKASSFTVLAGRAVEFPVATVLADHGAHRAGAAILYLEVHTIEQHTEAGCNLG